MKDVDNIYSQEKNDELVIKTHRKKSQKRKETKFHDSSETKAESKAIRKLFACTTRTEASCFIFIEIRGTIFPMTIQFILNHSFYFLLCLVVITKS